MKAGDLVKAELYFDGVAIVANNPSEGLTKVLVQTVSGNKMWVSKKELEVLNESR